MARKTKQEAQETRQHILDVALRLFSQQGVSSTSLGEIAKAAGVTRGAIYWHFKDKSDLFSEIWELSESNIGELELEYQAKFPGDPLSVLREILIHVLESTVTEERRRLLMEIIFHKCEFVGEMAVVQQAQRNLCLESYDRIEQTLKHCIEAKMLPADLMTRRAALMNPLMILVKIIKLRWIHILSYDQMVSRKINNQTTRCANSIFYTTLFTNSAPNYT